MTLATVGAASAALLVPANATTTVSGGDAGTNPPVIRGSSTTITSDSGALMYWRSGSVTNINNNAVAFAPQSAAFTTNSLWNPAHACVGDAPNPSTPPAASQANGANASPRQIITVTDPNHVVVATQVSPVRSITAFQSFTPKDPQPAPAASNYRGDSVSGSTHGMSFTLDLTGRAPGTYTVTTTNYNMTKSDKTGVGGGQGACVLGTPNPATGNKTVIPGPAPSTTTTFEYRPWQNTFVDVFGGGKVFANTTPREWEFTFGSAANTSSIHPAGAAAGAPANSGTMKLYSFPSTDPFLLPTAPACTADPESCLPAAAAPCDPAEGCTPRIMTINDVNGPQKLQGTFDLQTKAFIARANLNGISKLMASTGTENDAQIGALLNKLKNAAAAKGINLESLLNTKIRLANGANELDITLLQGLQIAPSSAKGVQIVSDTTVEAGVLLDIYVDLRASSCTGKVATNNSVPPRFTPSTGYGYKVEKSDLLPKIPAAGPLAAITSGPLFHITGKFAQGALVNTASAVIGIDSAAGEPNGYPVWVEPFLSAGHVNSPSTMDFLGTATWSASETNLGAFGCLVTDFLVGTGVALYNNPLPVGFGTLLDPLYKPSPAAANLLAQIDAAVQSVVGQASANPTVAALLAQIEGALPL